MRADAKQPEDWDEEEDGEWEPPRIPNPKCEDAPGCGAWVRPTKSNPAYKGKWSAPMIDNPAYKVRRAVLLAAGPACCRACHSSVPPVQLSFLHLFLHLQLSVTTCLRACTYPSARQIRIRTTRVCLTLDLTGMHVLSVSLRK